MKLPAAILSRSPKGGGGGGRSSTKGSSSSSKRPSSSAYRPTPAYYYGGSGHGGSGSGKTSLPWWAIFLIVYFSLFFTIFLVALIFYCTKERRRKIEKNKPFRTGYPIWKAFCAASGLWLIIWLVKRCRGDRGKAEPGPARTGNYTKIQEDHGEDHDNGNPRSGGWPGGYDAAGAAGPQATAYGGGALYDAPLAYGQQKQQESAREQPVITGPVNQTSAIPIPSPMASPAPSFTTALSPPPPPYAGSEANKPLPSPPQPGQGLQPDAHKPPPASDAALPASSPFMSSIEPPAAAHSTYAAGGSYNAGYAGRRGGAY